MKEKEALEYLIEQCGKNEEISLGDGRLFTTKKLNPILPEQPLHIEISTLDGLIDYITKSKDIIEDDDRNNNLIVIKTPTVILYCSSLNKTWQERKNYLEVRPQLGDCFHFGNYYKIEDFIIELQSKFVQENVVEDLLSEVGNISDGKIYTSEDDGISQKVEITKGVTRKAFQKITNPVTLRPFRTFPEIEQPESNFVLRLRSGRNEELPECALFYTHEALWKQKAMASIKMYLQERLKDVLIIA